MLATRGRVADDGAQRLAILDDVQKRGQVVTPAKPAVADRATLNDKRFPDLAPTRRLIKQRDVALSQAVIDERNDR